jgi:hypothetical protein
MVDSKSLWSAYKKNHFINHYLWIESGQLVVADFGA